MSGDRVDAELEARELRRTALGAVVAFGVVSLLADIVYEGARSIIGPFLSTLGASAAVVGFVAGIGELVGYGLRTFTGMIADRTRSYWTMTIVGYALTVVAVPLLGLVGRVDLALALIIAERLGKAVRSPARDTLIADAAEPLGRGLGFGIHEALDQTGAVTGPLILAAVLAAKQADYRLAFTVLAVPSLLTMVALFFAHHYSPGDGSLAAPSTTQSTARPVKGSSVEARRYLAFVAFGAVGFAPFPLIAFHVTQRALATDAQVPLMFAAAMAVDAVVALITGHQYDRRGLRVLLLLPVLSLGTVAAFASATSLVWAGVLAWGAVMGIQESTLRAAVGDLSGSERRATAYGVFNSIYGVALFLGGVVLGLLYDWSIAAVMTAIVVSQIASVAVLRSVLTPPTPTPGV